MKKVIVEAMKANSYYRKARNFKEAWESVNDLFDWSFHKSLYYLNLKWYQVFDRFEVSNSYNSYNSSSSITYQMCEFEYQKEKITAVCFHLGGDVRGNYGDLIFTKKSIYELLEGLSEIEFEYSKDGFSWYITPFIGEFGYIYAPYAYNRSESYNEKLCELDGYYIDKYPKGFVTAFEKVLP